MISQQFSISSFHFALRSILRQPHSQRTFSCFGCSNNALIALHILLHLNIHKLSDNRCDDFSSVSTVNILYRKNIAFARCGKRLTRNLQRFSTIGTQKRNRINQHEIALSLLPFTQHPTLNTLSYLCLPPFKLVAYIHSPNNTNISRTC